MPAWTAAPIGRHVSGTETGRPVPGQAAPPMVPAPAGRHAGMPSPRQPPFPSPRCRAVWLGILSHKRHRGVGRDGGACALQELRHLHRLHLRLALPAGGALDVERGGVAVAQAPAQVRARWRPPPPSCQRSFLAGGRALPRSPCMTTRRRRPRCTTLLHAFLSFTRCPFF